MGEYSEVVVVAARSPARWPASVGDSYHNALAETINGLYKAEVIHRRGPWRSFEAVEFATLEWVGLVQQSPAAGAHRQHPARRSRGTLLRRAARASHGSVTQTKQLPANPWRFKDMTAPKTRKPKIALDHRAASRHDDASGGVHDPNRLRPPASSNR